MNTDPLFFYEVRLPNGDLYHSACEAAQDCEPKQALKERLINEAGFHPTIVLTLDPNGRKPVSFKPVVQTGRDPKWYGNALRFATEEEAFESARALMYRWTSAVACGAAPSHDPVNYVRIHDADEPIAKVGES